MSPSETVTGRGVFYPAHAAKDNATCANCGSHVGMTVEDYYSIGFPDCALCDPDSWEEITKEEYDEQI